MYVRGEEWHSQWSPSNQVCFKTMVATGAFAYVVSCPQALSALCILLNNTYITRTRDFESVLVRMVQFCFPCHCVCMTAGVYVYLRPSLRSLTSKRASSSERRCTST